MENIELKISTDFSTTPGARYKEEGDFSGEEFRSEVLYPKYKEAKDKGCYLIINLDGTAGLGTSFLEESFGGLIRTNKVDYSELQKIIRYISKENPDYIDEILGYLRDAHEKEIQ
jgi:hypothetical protein